MDHSETKSRFAGEHRMTAWPEPRRQLHDHCRIMDCQDVIPEGHAHWWHCEAALADDFLPAGPDDVFHRRNPAGESEVERPGRAR